MNQGNGALPLLSLNHVSRVCKDVPQTKRFYESVLGFIEIVRPSSFSFEGSWLFGYGFGVHLIAGEPVERPEQLNPKADHLSFVTSSLEVAEAKLRECNIPYVKDSVVENGNVVTQLFFHDPDRNLIEICNCDCLPIKPLVQAAACCPSTCSEQDCMDTEGVLPSCGTDARHASVSSDHSDRSCMEVEQVRVAAW